MTTIRKKISVPIIAIIILIPFAIMLLFNFTVGYYAKSQAEVELKEASQNVADIIENNSENANNLATLLLANQKQQTVEVVAYNSKGGASRFFDSGSGFLNDEIIEKTYLAIKDVKIGEIASFKMDGNNYYAIQLDIEKTAMINKVVYISEGLFLDDFIRVVNILLLVISVVITAIALIISKKITKSLATPIEQITNSIENVKTDKLLQINTQTDTEEIQKLSCEFNRMSKRIYEYNKSQKTFLHNASHELRTPLMSIQGYADGIEMGVFEDAKGTAKLISLQSQKLTELVDRLLKLARVENHDETKLLPKIELANYIHELIATYKGYALTKNVQIYLHLENDIHVYATVELLREIIGNLLSNAIRYAKSQVDISCEIQNNKAKITVADNGNGVNQPEKIFERFYKGEGGNFGMGLSIAKTAVEKLGGNMTVRNQNGGVFEVYLPMS